ncbi:MAG: hypothetical protein RLZZ568_376, partial [Cyanobacteriota bacterium]
PYRFRKDSDERPKFYQIMARLIPQRHCFGFVSQIADPQAQTPKRVKKTAPGPGNQGERKPTREDKQDAPPLPNRKKITLVNNANDAAEIKPIPLQGSPAQTATDKVDTQARETPVATIKVQEAQTKLLTERVAPPEDPQPVDTVMDKPPAQVPHAPVLSQEKNQSAKTKALKESKSPKTEGNSSSR